MTLGLIKHRDNFVFYIAAEIEAGSRDVKEPATVKMNKLVYASRTLC
jgi:hypothetical protein